MMRRYLPLMLTLIIVLSASFVWAEEIPCSNEEISAVEDAMTEDAMTEDALIGDEDTIEVFGAEDYVFIENELFEENYVEEYEEFDDPQIFSEDVEETIEQQVEEAVEEEQLPLAGSGEEEGELPETQSCTYEEYIEKSFDLAGANNTVKRGDRLTGNNKIVYDYLLQEFQNVASGRRISTIFEIPLEKLSTGLGGSKEGFTAAELGLSYIGARYGNWNPDLGQALVKKYGIDFDRIIQSAYYDLSLIHI